MAKYPQPQIPIIEVPISVSLKEYKNAHEVLKHISNLTAQFKQEFKKLPSVTQLVYSLRGDVDDNNHWLSVWVDKTVKIEDNKELTWIKNHLPI